MTSFRCLNLCYNPNKKALRIVLDCNFPSQGLIYYQLSPVSKPLRPFLPIAPTIPVSVLKKVSANINRTIPTELNHQPRRPPGPTPAIEAIPAAGIIEYNN